MSTDTNSVSPSTVDEGILSVCHSSKEKLKGRLAEWEDCVKQHPVKSIAAAVAAGALIHRLPVRSILAANVKVVGALLPPALFAYGAAKLCEILQQKGGTPRRTRNLAPLTPIDIGDDPRESRY